MTPTWGAQGGYPLDIHLCCGIGRLSGYGLWGVTA